MTCVICVICSNNFAPLVDIFLHYASPKQEGGVETPEKDELAINMKSFAKFVRYVYVYVYM